MRSKKTLMVIFAGDEEKDLVDGLMWWRGCESESEGKKVERVRN